MMSNQESYLLLIGKNGSKIEGDVEHLGYLKQISLVHWEWKLEEANSSEKPSRENDSAFGEREKSQTITIEKRIDVATAAMLTYLDEGDSFPSAKINLVQDTARKILLSIELTNVRPMSCEVEISDEEDAVDMKETWELNYQNIEVSYKGEDGRFFSTKE